MLIVKSLQRLSVVVSGVRQVMSNLRLTFLILLSALLMACASALTLSSNHGLLEEEIARLPPVKPIRLRATLTVDASEFATGQKPGLTGDPSFSLEFPAREMLEQAAQAEISRWFRNDTQDRNSVRLDVRLHSLLWDKYTDVLVWRPVVSAEVELHAENDSRTLVRQVFSSGKQKGEWVKDFEGQTMITQEHQPQYTRMIYRSLLIALDKAMADVAQQLMTSSERSLPSTQRNLSDSVRP